MNATANFAMRDWSASILPLMRASAPLRRLSSASNTAVAFRMTTAWRQRQLRLAHRDKTPIEILESDCLNSIRQQIVPVAGINDEEVFQADVLSCLRH